MIILGEVVTWGPIADSEAVPNEMFFASAQFNDVPLGIHFII